MTGMQAAQTCFDEACQTTISKHAKALVQRRHTIQREMAESTELELRFPPTCFAVLHQGPAKLGVASSTRHAKLHATFVIGQSTGLLEYLAGFTAAGSAEL